MESTLYSIDTGENSICVPASISSHDWSLIIGLMKERALTRLTAPAITDAALAYLAGVETLQHLNISGAQGQITDSGLAALRHLPGLRHLQLSWQPNISDAGVANLAACNQLESVDLMGTPTGDGAIRALTGKRKLRRLKTGRYVSDAGLALLQQFPIFKTWQGGEVKYSLMSADAEPNHLLLDGPFTDGGITSLAGLDGLFALTFFWHCSAITPEGLGPLDLLPNLGFLGCGGEFSNDQAMRHIAALPRLRMLMAQGSVASDSGFETLSGSRTLEYIWGRECPKLRSRGFTALGRMPNLRGLAVSCKHVDDAALAELPRFPALREFMPMDVPDEGFRHIGRCAALEALWCMYCRDTGDAATEHITGLSRLKSYYAGRTQITDRSLEILSRMTSLERLEFRECAKVTNTGLAHLATLPGLREVTLTGLPGVTRDAIAWFPADVQVRYSA